MLKSSRKGRIVNRSELAAIYGVSTVTVDAWIRRGCPYVTKANRAAGQRWEFDTAAVAAWREQQAAANVIGDTAQLDISEARRRKVAAEAALSELELSIARLENIPARAVIACWQAKTVNARAKLLALPSKIVVAALEASTPYAVETAVRELIYEALEELSGDGMPDTLKHRLSHQQNGHAEL